MDYEKNKTIAIMKQMVADGKITQADAEKYCPEIAESEDEKMMNQLHSWMKEFGGAEEYTEKVYQWIKGLLEKQGEQKPADKVEPKFKVGDKVKSFIDGFECTIESIDNTCYYGDTTNFDIQDQDGWELVEQKPAWSDEDEKFFKTALWHISYSVSNGKNTDEHCDTTDWLKSLKNRYAWKPSKEQIIALQWILNNLFYCRYKKEISELLDQIKDL